MIRGGSSAQLPIRLDAERETPHNARMAPADRSADLSPTRGGLAGDPSALVAPLRTRFGLRIGIGLVAGLAIALAIAIATTAAAAAIPDGAYLVDNWQIEDGLPQISVHSVIQGADGFLWLATNAGLTRFDGRHFVVFNARNTPELTSSLVRVLLTDAEGTLWIGTRGGLVRRRGGRFERFTTADGLPSDDIQTLYLDRRGRLWIGTHDGVARHDGGRFLALGTADGLPHGSVWTLYEDHAGSLWIGTEGGLVRRAGEGLETFTTADGLSHDVIFEVFEDRRQQLWVATGAALDRRVGDRFETDPSARAIRPPVWFFREDDAGRLWTGTDRGLFVRENDAWTRFEPPEGLLDERVFDLVEDEEGSLWIGTGYQGLVRLRPRWIDHFGVAEGLPHHVTWTVLQDRRGAMWIATRNGLLRRDPGGETTLFTTADGLPSANVNTLAEDPDGRLWVGTLSGLARLDGERFVVEPWMTELEPKRANHLHFDAEDNLWIGTHGGGLVRHRGGKLDRISLAEGLPHAIVHDLAEGPDGSLWIATEGGLVRLVDGKLDGERVVVVVPGLAQKLVSTLYADPEGGLWIGTWGDGLHRLQGDELASFTVEDGLYDDQIHQILEDDRGRLWMSGDRGVWSVSKTELDAVAAGRRDAVTPISYDEYDGMASRECIGGNQPAGWRARDGRLWFPTLQGVAIFDSSHLEPSAVAPPVQIESARADGTALAIGERAVLEAGTRLLEIGYTAPSFIAPHKLRFRYRLEGFDEEWQHAGDRRSAFYTNLPHGEYHFRVDAKSRNGVWSEPGAIFAVTVLPAFYETWAFWLASAAGLLLLGRGVHLYRVRGLLHQNAELARVRHELETKNAELERFIYAVSHDLKSPLFTIQGFLGMLETDALEGRRDRLQTDVEHIRTAAVQMRHLLDELLELSRLGRVIHPPEDVPLCDLAHEAAKLVAGRIRAKKVEVEIAPDLPVVRGDRRRLLEVFQNLIDNAVKFIGDEPAPRIEIGLRPAPRDSAVGAPVIEVRDNGVGIDPRYLEKVFGLFDQLDAEDEGTGIGLALVKRIVELHGGKIWVESQGLGHGSTFCFTLPGLEGDATSQA